MMELFGVATKLKPTARCRVVAAITRRGKIMSIGHNSYNSCRLARQFKKHDLALYNHAEVNAIHNFLRRYPAPHLKKCKIYVCRVKLIDGVFILGASKPCIGCLKAIHAFGLKDVIYQKFDCPATSIY